ncbi:MAG: helix-turn-helix domain-containing protein [Bauldia sp.]
MTAFGIRPTFRSEAARRIEAAGRAFAEAEARTSGTVVRPAAPRAAAAAAPEPKRRGPGACHRIIAEVAAKHDIPTHDILSDQRARALIPARHEAIWRCVMETPLSLPAIGRVFNRDHTSIGHAVMRHHLTTGAPLPRGMDWKAGRRKRHPRRGETALPDGERAGAAA